MSELNESQRKLFVHLNHNCVGELFLNLSTMALEFNYLPQWVKENSESLSPRLPLSKDLEEKEIRYFLENLIPEGRGLQVLKRELKVKGDNLFEIIRAIGGETAGALSFLKEPNFEVETKFIPIDKDDLLQRIADRQKIPIFKWNDKIRLSIAGVQDKLPVLDLEGEIGFGEGQLCSNQILKFGNQEAQHLCLNEFFCMKLAEACELSVPNVELLQMGERVLKVQRFDREQINKKLIAKKHIIDLCQVLGLAPDHKYERFLGDSDSVKDILGPANAENLFSVANLCDVPILYKQKVLDWVLFNLIIGNCDNHFKNLSFFWDGKKLKLSPFYDLVSIEGVYKHFSQSMAFRIGSSFELLEISRTDWEEFCEETGIGVSYLKSRWTHLESSIVKAQAILKLSELSMEENLFIDSLWENIHRRVDVLKVGFL